MSFPDYSIANDTANGTVDPSALHAELVAAGPYSAKFHGIHTDPDNDLFKLEFADTIPAGEQTTVDGVVAAHTATPLPVKAECPVLISPNGSSFEVVVADDGTLSTKKV
jgi:hypothetical protein